MEIKNIFVNKELSIINSALVSTSHHLKDNPNLLDFSLAPKTAYKVTSGFQTNNAFKKKK